ncbi:MAG: DUF748 domain-containing protein [Bacteroidia bacterium]
MSSDKKQGNQEERKSHRRKFKYKWRIILALILLVVIIRLILPYFVLRYANKTLASMHGYYGHVDDIDLAIIRGAYVIKSIYLNKVDTLTSAQTPFFNSRAIDLSVEWNALLHGRLVGELIFNDAELMFTKDKAEPAQVQKDTSDFRKLLDSFMPLKVNRFEVNNGKIHFIDSSTTPPVNIFMNDTYILAKNLSSVRDTSLLPAVVDANANVYNGRLTFNMRLDPLADDPTFDINSELKNTHLPSLNDFFKAYGKFDVNEGTFGLYTELAANKGKFTGYVKPVIKDLDVVGAEDRHDNILQKLWEHIIGAAGMILENRKTDQIATKVPIKGTFNKDTQTDIWYAVFDLLRNAFIQAIQPAIDYEINIYSVFNSSKKEKKGFFGRVFGKNNSKKEEKEK